MAGEPVEAPVESRSARDWRSLARALVATWAGRAILGGLAVKLAISALQPSGGSASGLLGLIDLAAGLAIAMGGGYFLVRLVMRAQRRLLWRVRRKLILSYVL